MLHVCRCVEARAPETLYSDPRRETGAISRTRAAMRSDPARAYAEGQR